MCVKSLIVFTDNSNSEQSIPYSFGSGTTIIAGVLLSEKSDKFVHINSSMPKAEFEPLLAERNDLLNGKVDGLTN